MRFFISSNIKSNAPLYMTVIFFLAFTLLFWATNWFYYHWKFGLTYRKMFVYFFTDPEFPERIPIAQLLEDIHIQLFLYSLFLLALSSIFVHKCVRDRVKYALIGASFGSGILEPVSGLLPVFISPLFIYLKIFLFLLFQISTGLMIFFALKLYLTKEKEEPPERGILYTLVFLFAGSVILFATINFFLFIAKFGILPSQVATYFLGNPELFIKKKTLQGLMNVFNPHLISMAVYIFTVVHFAFFTNLRRKIYWSVLLFGFAFLDNASGPLILYFGLPMAYVKSVSFIIFTGCLYYTALLVMISIIRHRARPIVVL